MRLLLAAVLLTAALCACTTQRAKIPAEPVYPWFNFTWYKAQVAGRTFDKAAMLVPVQLLGLRGNFVAQFDLGSDGTSLYENALRNYFASRAQLYATVDTTQRLVSDGGQVSYVTAGLPLHVGPTIIAHPVLARGAGELVSKDSLHSTTPKMIGTIGANFPKGKVLIIDYPRQRMCVLDSVDTYWRARTTFVASRMRKGRLHIPLTINQHTYWALFDTGASLFPLSTDEHTWKTLVATGPPTDSMRVSSWGEQVAFYGAPIQSDVYLGATKLPRGQAWFNRNKRLLAFNAEEQIAALTGNGFFSTSILVLDYQRNRFGVVY
ncbi:hypothetical protein [Hymenobacter sp. UYP22]|uniref:hypothetical protein n=1 Tax=Hymenobacter sp. UYP22 TaxID=3156348 RepID=UPI0033943E03